MKRIAALAMLGLAAGFAMLGLGGVAAAADNASVSVVHGIPKTPVNVFVNGKLTLRDFQPGKVAGPAPTAPVPAMAHAAVPVAGA